MRSYLFDFWSTLLSWMRFQNVGQKYLDIPLEAAESRAKSVSFWTGLMGTAWLLLSYSSAWSTPLNRSMGHPGWGTFTVSVGAIVLLPVLGLLVYGFLRLYTLVHHTMTVNVFKSRGQRLRLLNFLTTLMPLTALFLAAHALSLLIPVAGIVLMFGVGAVALVQVAKTYNLIFHQNHLRGFALFFGATLVTWFVLAIGALGVAVVLAVLSFFVIVLVRIFQR